MNQIELLTQHLDPGRKKKMNQMTIISSSLWAAFAPRTIFCWTKYYFLLALLSLFWMFFNCSREFLLLHAFLPETNVNILIATAKLDVSLVRFSKFEEKKNRFLFLSRRKDRWFLTWWPIKKLRTSPNERTNYSGTLNLSIITTTTTTTISLLPLILCA